VNNEYQCNGIDMWGRLEGWSRPSKVQKCKQIMPKLTFRFYYSMVVKNCDQSSTFYSTAPKAPQNKYLPTTHRCLNLEYKQTRIVEACFTPVVTFGCFKSLVRTPLIIIITKNLYYATKCRCKLSSTRLSATVGLGTNKCVFSILLKLNKEIELSCKSLGVPCSRSWVTEAAVPECRNHFVGWIWNVNLLVGKQALILCLFYWGPLNAHIQGGSLNAPIQGAPWKHLFRWLLECTY